MNKVFFSLIYFNCALAYWFGHSEFKQGQDFPSEEVEVRSKGF